MKTRKQTILEESKQINDDFIHHLPFPTKQIVLVMSGGELRYAKPDEFLNKKDEMQTYSLETSDGLFKVYDVDKSSVKPIVKSILNQIALFPEILWLKRNFMLSCIIALIAFITMFVVFGRSTTGSVETAQKKIEESIKKYCAPAELLKNDSNGSNLNDFNKKDITHGTGAKKGTGVDF